MSAPFFAEHDVTIWQGSALDILSGMPDGSVNCCVTSPPYYGLRDYGCDGQIGLEESPAVYVEALRALFDEVRRVLRPDGVLWLNLGDSYSSASGGAPTSANTRGKDPDAPRAIRPRAQDFVPPKNLLGIPWRTAFALQDDGWTLRNAVVWHKPNAMPESVTDRLSTRHEHVFLFSKARRYWFDLDAIREPALTMQPDNPGFRAAGKSDRRRKAHAAPPGQSPQTNLIPTGTRHSRSDTAGRNPGDVWTIPTAPFPGAHFACMPPALARRCILAGCPEGGIVLDPFAGSGTTLMVARQLGRKSIGIELNPDYCALAVERIGDVPFDFGASA